VKTQTLAGRVEEREREAKVDQLRMISGFPMRPGRRRGLRNASTSARHTQASSIR
jgi:hypothetical protein